MTITINPYYLVGSKGISISENDRKAYAHDRIRNSFVSGIQGAGLGVATGICFASPRIRTKLTSVFDKLAAKLPKSSKVSELLAKTPGKAKAAVLLALPLLVGLSCLSDKYNYNRGRIDQFYIDESHK